MLEFQTIPIPDEEARRRIADKPAVARDVFDRLLEGMWARAFTIRDDGRTARMLCGGSAE